MQVERKTIGSHNDSPVNFVYCPKNACSSLKCTLLRSIEDPHEKFQDIFCNGSIDIYKPFFVVSRNPFDRILSCYLNKIIGPERGGIIWQEFATKYNLDPTKEISFTEFLNILGDDSAPEAFDLHYRPQVFVNNFFFLRPYFTGRFERFAEISEFLEAYGFRVIRRSPHRTSAAQFREHFSQEQIFLVRKIYKLDFYCYGYDDLIQSQYAPPSLYQTQFISKELLELSTI